MQKILFSDEFGLTNLVLNGQKNMTRLFCHPIKSKQLIFAREVDSFQYCSDEHLAHFYMKNGSIITSKPKYLENEIVAVAQPYCQLYSNPNKALNHIGQPLTMAAGWKHKRYVQPAYMPHQIQILSINIEHLNDISETDCLKEGIFIQTTDVITFGYLHCQTNIFEQFNTAQKAFKNLISQPQLKGYPEIWDDNPFVFVYEFKLVK